MTKPNYPPQIQALDDAEAALTKAASLIDTALDGLKDQTLGEAATFYHHLKASYDALDTQRKRVYKALDFLSKGLLPEMMEQEGTDKIQVPELGKSFYILKKFSASMVDKQGAMNWLRERGDGALVTETVNASTLASYLKDLMLNEGVEAPEDLFKLTSYNATGSSSYKPK